MEQVQYNCTGCWWPCRTFHVWCLMWENIRGKIALRIPVAWLQEKNARTRSWCTLVQSRTNISSSLNECSIPNQKDPYPFKRLQDKRQINSSVGHYQVQRTPTLLSLTFASALNKLLLCSLCSSAPECVFIFLYTFVFLIQILLDELNKSLDFWQSFSKKCHSSRRLQSHPSTTSLSSLTLPLFCNISRKIWKLNLRLWCQTPNCSTSCYLLTIKSEHSQNSECPGTHLSPQPPARFTEIKSM